MLNFRLSTTLLFAAVCCITSAERDITCGYYVQHLSCDQGVIRVQAASYGRTDRETCSEGRPPSQLSNTACSLRGTLDILTNRCDGKTVCETDARVFPSNDPCRGIYKYLNTTYTCLPANRVVACEGSVAQLFCDVGQAIVVYGADYGRRDRTTCSLNLPAHQIQNVLCLRPTTKVAQRCNGRNSCSIDASNSVFGDPCFGTYKYLEVAYACEYHDV